MANGRLRKLQEEREENASLSSSTSETNKVGRLKQLVIQRDIETTNNIMNDTSSGWQDKFTMANNRNVLTGARNRVSGYLDNNNLSDNERKTYSGLLNNYDSALSSLDNYNNFYRNYKNADAYGKAKSDYANAGKSYDEIQNAIAKSTDEKEKRYLKSFTNYTTVEDFDKAIAAEEKNVADLQAQRMAKGYSAKVKSTQLDKLKKGREKLVNDQKKNERIAPYKELITKPDFERLSSDESAMLRNESGTAADPARNILRGQTPYAESLTGDDRKIATYLYNKGKEENDVDLLGTPKEYKEYLKKVAFKVRENERREMAEEFNAMANEKPIAVALQSTVWNTAYAGLNGIADLQAKLQGIDAPSTLGNLSSAINEANSVVSENIADATSFLPNIPIVNKNPLQLGYDVATQYAPNRLRQMAGYAMGGKAGQRVINAIMGLDAFSSTYNNKIYNGASADDALLDGLVAGILEYGTEEIGGERAFGRDVISPNRFANGFRQAGGEAIEEFVSGVGNNVFDVIHNREDSDILRKYNQYLTMGYAPSEAYLQVTADIGSEILYDMLVAAISTTPDVAVSNHKTSNVGKNVDIEKLDKAIGQLPEGSETRQKFINLVEKLGSIDKMSDFAKGQAYQEAYNETQDKVEGNAEKIMRADERGDARKVDKYGDEYVKYADAYMGVRDSYKASEESKAESKNESKTEEIKPAEERKQGFNVVADARRNITPEDMEKSYINRQSSEYSKNVQKIFEENFSGDADAYKVNFDVIKSHVKAGDTLATTLNSISKSTMTDSKAIAIYDALRAEQTRVRNERSAANDELRAKWDRKLRNGKFVEENLPAKLSETDQAKIDYAKNLAIVGKDVHVFKDYNSKDAGFVNVKNGEIWLNLAARYSKKDKATLEEFYSTAEHENTHFDKVMLGEEWDNYRDEVHQAMGDTQWKSAVTKKLNQMKADPNNLTEAKVDEAEEEVVADFNRRFSSAEAFDEFLSKIDENKVQKFFRAIKENLSKFFKEIADKMQGYEDKYLAKETAEMSKDVENALKKSLDKMRVRALEIQQARLQERETSGEELDKSEEKEDNEVRRAPINDVKTYGDLYSEGEDFSDSLSAQRYTQIDQMMKKNPGLKILSGEYILTLGRQLIYHQDGKITRVVSVLNNKDSKDEVTLSEFAMGVIRQIENLKQFTGRSFKDIAESICSWFGKNFGGKLTIDVDYGRSTYTDAIIGVGRQEAVRPPVNIHFEDDEDGEGNNKTSEGISVERISDKVYSELVKNDPEEARIILDKLALENGAISLPKEGEPTHFYHGTGRKDFNSFEIDRSHSGWSGIGFYFTSDKNFANEYAKREDDIYEVYLFPKKLAFAGQKEITANDLHDFFEDYDFSEVSDEVYAALVYHAGSSFKDTVRDIQNDRKIKQSVEDYVKYHDDRETLISLQELLIYQGKSKSEALRILRDEFGYYGVSSSRETVVWFPNDIKSADLVTYDDKGKEIPLSNRFEDAVTDIRYSEILDEGDQLREMFGNSEQLTKDVATLNEDIARLRELLKLQGVETKGKVFKPNQLHIIAKHLKNVANSNISEDVVVDRLNTLYNNIVDQISRDFLGGDTDDTEYLISKCKELAREILNENKGTKIIFPEFKEAYDTIRNTKIKLSEEEKEAMRKAYGNNWYHQTFGRFKFVNDGISLSQAFNQWNKQFGWALDEVLDTKNPSSTEMVNVIGDLYSLVHDSMEMTSYLVEETDVQRVAEEIYNKFWNVSTLETVADKYASKINDLRFKHRQAMDSLRQSKEDELKQLRADKNAVIKAVKEDRDHKLKEYKLYRDWMEGERKERAQKKAYISRITDTALTLEKWIDSPEGKKGKSIPEPLQGPIADLLGSIDMTSQTAHGMRGEERLTKKDISIAKRMRALQDAMTEKNGAAGLFGGIHESLAQEMGELAASIEEMSDNTYDLWRMKVDDLEKFAKIMKVIKGSVIGFNKRLGEENKALVSDAAETDLVANKEKGRVEYGKHSFKGVRNFMLWDMALPVYACKHLGDGCLDMFNGLRKGYDRFVFKVKDVMDWVGAKDENGNYINIDPKKEQEWKEKVETVQFTYMPNEAETAEGAQPVTYEVKMTVSQIMSLYCLSKREQANNHLLKGGMRIENFKTKNDGEIRQGEDTFKLSQESIDEITSILDKYDGAIDTCNKIMEFMNSYCKDWVNETTMKQWMIQIANEENYFPIETISPDADDVPSLKRTSIFDMLNYGFTKSINENANNALVVRDIFNVFLEHAIESAKYNTLALPVLDMYRYYNYVNPDTGESMTSSIRKTYGEQAIPYLRDLLEGLNGTVENPKGEGALNWLFRNYKTAAVGFNAQVMSLQPISISRAKMFLSNKYLLQGAAKISKASAEEMLNHSGIAYWKNVNLGFETDVASPIARKVMGEESVGDKLKNVALAGAGLADDITWTTIWNACKAEQKDKGYTGDMLLHATTERFEEVIYYTQVVDSPLTRSQIMRRKSWGSKILTSFMSEAMVTVNMLTDAGIQWRDDYRRYGKNEAFKRNGRHVARTVYLYVLNSALEGIVRAAWGRVRRPDEDEDELYIDFLKEFAKALNPMSNIPLAREVSDWVESLIEGRTYRASRPETAILETAGYAVTKLLKVAQGEKDVDYKTIYYSLQTISQATGVPLSSLARDAVALWNAVIGEQYPSLHIETK